MRRTVSLYLEADVDPLDVTDLDKRAALVKTVRDLYDPARLSLVFGDYDGAEPDDPDERRG